MAFLDLELKLCGQHIECVRQFVFLGITIHETLNWDRYIDKIANKISRTLGVMNKLKHFLPKYTLKIMYSSLIAPHFNNNILLWGFNTHRLIKLQNRAIRIITDSVDSAKSIHCSVCVLQMTRHVSFSFFLVYKQFDARCCVVNLQINQ